MNRRNLPCYHRAEGGEIERLGSRRVRWLVTGVAGGFFSGLTGVGGGAVMVPLLTGLLGLSQYRAHGTSLAVVVFVASAGFFGYWLNEHIEWSLVLWLAVGSVVGAYFGASAMARLPERWLRLLFGCFLVAVAVRLFIT